MASTSPLSSTLTFPVLPLRELVVFPYMVVPLFVGRESSLNAVKHAQENEREILIITQKTASEEDPVMGDLYDVGTVAQILQVFKMPDGVMKVLVEGNRRARVSRLIPRDNFLEVEAEILEDDDETTAGVQALMRSVNELFEQYVKSSKKIPSEVLVVANNVESSGRLADIISANLSLKIEEKQEILAAEGAEDRLRILNEFIQRELDIVTVEKAIADRVRKQMEQLQKEYYMREQLKAIQRELGEADELSTELEELQKRIAGADLPEHAMDKAQQELEKLAKMGINSAESTVIRNYLDVICDLPWAKLSEDKMDISKAKSILDRDHHALSDPKDRILEYLSVLRLKKEIKGPILCFMGPPGVGKTSLAKSIADALGRPFVRMSLGGIKDEAEVRGHRRTYVGAMPGRILQLIRRAGTRNPVFLLDEIDKTGSDWRGDISSALLEVLDPEQNSSFDDHYLGMPFDLSQVLFITTANIPHSIPGPLRDRMEIIRIPGYTEIEKLAIGTKFLVRKQMKENGLTRHHIELTEDALVDIIRQYTSEAGIRDLERQVGKIMRRVAKDCVTSTGPKEKVVVTAKTVSKYLGIPKYVDDETDEANEIGVATGLSWTTAGGQTMPIEAVVMEGTGAILMTGNLGEVMKESVKAAISHIRSNESEFGLKPDFHKKFDIHVHAPEGGIPKDGPSSGITVATAVASALTNRAVRRDLAMTGEITLQGKILAVEGIKEKALAAYRRGLKEVLIPFENVKDLEEVPKEIRNGLKFTQVRHVAEVLAIALEPRVAPQKTERRPLEAS